MSTARVNRGVLTETGRSKRGEERRHCRGRTGTGYYPSLSRGPASPRYSVPSEPPPLVAAESVGKHEHR